MIEFSISELRMVVILTPPQWINQLRAFIFGYSSRNCTLEINVNKENRNVNKNKNEYKKRHFENERYLHLHWISYTHMHTSNATVIRFKNKINCSSNRGYNTLSRSLSLQSHCRLSFDDVMHLAEYTNGKHTRAKWITKKQQQPKQNKCRAHNKRSTRRRRQNRETEKKNTRIKIK